MKAKVEMKMFKGTGNIWKGLGKGINIFGCFFWSFHLRNFETFIKSGSKICDIISNNSQNTMSHVKKFSMFFLKKNS